MKTPSHKPGFRAVPPTWLLVFINVAGWCTFGSLEFLQAAGLGKIVIAVMLAVVLALTVGIQLLMHLLLRRRHLRPWARTLIFMAPTLLLCVVLCALYLGSRYP